MDRLPTEVLHLICKRLSKEDIANLRLVSCRLSEIASFYLVDTVHFNTSHNSFERLKLLADHPIFHQTITTVVYEACTIGQVGCRHAYFQHFEMASHCALNRPTLPEAMATEREKRLYERNMRKFDHEVTMQWEQYTMKLKEQQKLLTKSQLDLHIGNAVAKLPHISVLRFSPIKNCVHVMSHRFIDEFGTTCSVPLSANPSVTPIQLRPLLLPNGRSCKALRKLHIEAMSPTFFSDSNDKSALVEVFKQLLTLELSFSVHTDHMEAGDDNFEAVMDDLFDSDILRDSLAAAQNLENLDLGIFSKGLHVLDATKYLIGETIWPNLKTLCMDSFKMSQNAFLDLLKRHPVLTTVSIAGIKLYDGSWISTLDALRRNLKPLRLLAYGYIMDQDDVYDLDQIEMSSYVNEGLRFTLSEAIDCYIDEKDEVYCDPNPLEIYDDEFYDLSTLEDEFGALSTDDDLYMFDDDDDGSRLHDLTDFLSDYVTGATDSEDMHE